MDGKWDGTTTGSDARSGSILWQWRASQGVAIDPVLHEGESVVAITTSPAFSDDPEAPGVDVDASRLVVLDKRTGSELWSIGFDINGDDEVAAVDDLILLHRDGRLLEAFDAATGLVRWTVDDGPTGTSGLDVQRIGGCIVATYLRGNRPRSAALIDPATGFVAWIESVAARMRRRPSRWARP